MADTTSRWAIRFIDTWTLKNVANTQVFGLIDDLKTCNIENAQENVYTMGSRGNVYFNAFSHSKRVTGTASAATWDNSIVACVTGTDEVVGSASAPFIEIATITSDASATTNTATGTVNSEIIGLFLLNDNGTLGVELDQAAAAASGEFKYTFGTKVLDFNASDYDDGQQIKIFYQYASGTGTRTLSNKTDEFSKIVRIEMAAIVQDSCGDRQEYAANIIVFAAKLQGNFAMDLAADGEPAPLDVSFEALQATCGDTTFWDLQIIDPPA